MLLNGHDHHSMSTDRHVPFRGFDPYDEVRTARRRLPHWRQPGVSYFVTFRLADSVPQPLLRQWRHERAIWLRLHPQPWGVGEQREYKEIGSGHPAPFSRTLHSMGALHF